MQPFWRNASFVDRVLLVASAVALIESGELAYLASSQYNAIPIVWPVFAIGQVGCFAIIVFTLRGRQRRNDTSAPSNLAQVMPGLTRLLLAAVIAISITAFVTAAATYNDAASSLGDPVHQDGKYFVDDHGSLVQITFDQYKETIRAQQESFTGFSLLFYFLAIANVGFVQRRARWVNDSQRHS